MDMHIIKMPDIGEGIAEVEIAEWHVDVGDQVAEDQVLADVMTDKASVEIPSPISGTVVSLGGKVGDILAVGSELITLQPDGDELGSGSQDRPLMSADTIPEPRAEVESQAGDRTVTSENTIRAPEIDAVSSAAPVSHYKVLASPSVRQRARQLDIDLHDLAHENRDTPVSHHDLDQFLLKRFSPAHSESMPSPESMPGQTTQTVAMNAQARTQQGRGERGDTDIRVVGLRRQIALKMQESMRQIPHFSYVEEIDVTELEQLRHTLNDDAGTEQDRLTLLPFIIRAMVLAVERFPEINARYDSENGLVTQFGAVHMGVATQTEQGLMVPVLHDAQSLDIWECASEIKRLAAVTRRGRAQRHELSGSTLTISSLGPLGGIAATPIINHPEVAIVGVNRIVERPVFQNGQLVSRKVMNLSSSFDHRVIDGMNAAQFIQEVRRLLEAPVLLFVRG